MGISGKWFRSLIGQKKQKEPHPEKTGSASNKHSQDARRASEAAGSKRSSVDTPTGSISRPAALQATELRAKEHRAATLIQSQFRAFLARRALHALRGLVILQGIVRGDNARKQAAQRLRHVQALTRARQVRVALEAQEMEQEAVHETEEGWCDDIGSKEEIQAKALRRQEAASKRARAMAYAMTHQWQASSRHQEADGNGGWGSKWLDRWMAVRPWENKARGAARDGVADTQKPKKAARKKSVSSESAETGSSGRSPILPSASSPSSLTSEKQPPARPLKASMRSLSSPKERPPALLNSSSKKMPSLPKNATVKRPTEKTPRRSVLQTLQNKNCK